MTIESLQTWKNELENLPKVTTPVWALNFANWYADMIRGIESDPISFQAVGFSFSFPTSAFASALSALPPTTDPASGILGFASAWESAILSTMVSVAPGSIIPPPSPPTTFSVVTSSLIDPSSILAGKAKILELVDVSVVGESQFPIKFREATLLLTFTVAGLDSTPSPSGPLPLTASNIPFI